MGIEGMLSAAVFCFVWTHRVDTSLDVGLRPIYHVTGSLTLSLD